MPNALNEAPNAESLPDSATAGTIVNGRYLPPPQDKDGKIWVRTSALVNADAQRLYELWSDVENVPLWQEQMVSVKRIGDKKTHWVMKTGDKDSKKTVEWDSELLADQPGHRLAWRSLDGEVKNAGEVVFEPSPGGHGTMVTVLQEFRMGKLASAWETLTGRNPKQLVIENLRHFKALVETGEIPRTEGQPHGPRGAIAGMKESAYGEKITTPPGFDQKRAS